MALAGVIGPAVFWVVTVLLGLTRPEYSPVRQTISALALGAHGWIQTLNFFQLGLSIAAFGISLRRNVKHGKDSSPIVAMALVFGVGFVTLALFPENAAGQRTLHGLVHALTVGVLAIFFPVACFLIAKLLRSDPRWRGYAGSTMLAGVLSLVIAAAWGVEANGPSDHLNGLYERVLLAVPTVWMGGMAVRLLRGPSRSAAATRRRRAAEVERPDASKNVMP